MADIRQNDAGCILRLTIQEGGIPVDVSAAVCSVVLIPPIGAARPKPAAFFTNGTDGVIEYELAAGDINLSGVWFIQAHCIFAALDVRSARVQLNVEPSPV